MNSVMCQANSCDFIYFYPFKFCPSSSSTHSTTHAFVELFYWVINFLKIECFKKKFKLKYINYSKICMLSLVYLLVQSEVNFLGRVSHPNLVRLLGYCWEDKELLLIYEFMQKGSLENHLFGRKG